MLAKRLSLIHNSKIYHLIMNIVILSKIASHLVYRGETPKSKGEISIHASDKKSHGTRLLMEPCLIHESLADACVRASGN